MHVIRTTKDLLHPKAKVHSSYLHMIFFISWNTEYISGICSSVSQKMVQSEDSVTTDGLS